MSDPVYQKFVKKWEQVTDLPPQSVGPLTPIYKIFTRKLKTMPWPVLILVSICLIFGLYYFIGSTIVLLTSILQRGF